MYKSRAGVCPIAWSDSCFLCCDWFQLDDRQAQPLPTPNQLRRLRSYVFSSSTLETEQYPHPGGSLLQRSRSAESSPARVPSRRHLPLAPGSPRRSVLGASRLQIQQIIARLMNKT